ncbi:DnaB-like helicase N-terminal domain-containing protein [Embleya sp. NBC_00896]|uniref:DnaB-like helicase N-terminal domain-containing protein n=1 Tax=Embleya sp. NBC_00896 TaxID=2975961 RepID=UPI003867C821
MAALIADPAPLGEIARRLFPTDFADPAHAALYRSVAALVHRGEAVDPLTVLWEAQRRGNLADGPLTTELVISRAWAAAARRLVMVCAIRPVGSLSSSTRTCPCSPRSATVSSRAFRTCGRPAAAVPRPPTTV